MDNTFRTILEMSVTASIAAIVIMILRWVSGGRLPRVFSYVAWVIVLARLVVPFAVSSSFSIFNIVPTSNAAIGEKIFSDDISRGSVDYKYSNDISTVLNNLYKGENNVYPSKGENLVVTSNERFDGKTESSKKGIDNKPEFIFVAAYIWLLIALAMAAFSFCLYRRTSKKLETAVLYKENDLVEQCSKRLNIRSTIKVYISDMINTPVVAGLVNVRIIIPSLFINKCSKQDLQHMIMHELVHIKRYDYIIKPLSVLALCIHWFNPVVWLSFILAQKDMETSCDEKVLSVNNSDVRCEYARALISIAARQNIILNGWLLAFGESNIKSRIKGIMRFKKTKSWIVITAVSILLIFALVLLTDGQRADNTNKTDNTQGYSYLRLIEDNQLSNLMEHRSKYIGDASNVGNLLAKLPYGDQRKGISLQTSSEPYGITVNYELDSIEKLPDESRNLKAVLIDNVLVIFSLIENVENVSFNIANGTVNFNRAEMQQYFEKDLWSYSSDKNLFEEFILDISFKVQVFPEQYSLFMSSNPGIRIDVALNGAYYKTDFDVKYSADKGSLLTWDRNTEKVSKAVKTISLNYGHVYWTPLNMQGKDNSDTVTISIMDEEKNVIIQKQIRIIKDAEFYFTKPSYDISILKKINPEENGDAYYVEPSIDVMINIHDEIKQESASLMREQGVNHSTLEEQMSLEEKMAALKIVEQYFSAFSKADYETMMTLATQYHNENYVHNGDVWGMKWATAVEIKYVDNSELKIMNQR